MPRQLSGCRTCPISICAYFHIMSFAHQVNVIEWPGTSEIQSIFCSSMKKNGKQEKKPSVSGSGVLTHGNKVVTKKKLN